MSAVKVEHQGSLIESTFPGNGTKKPNSIVSCQRLTVILGETGKGGDGWYWRLEVKWEDGDGNVLHITPPFVARDDTGCGPLVLNNSLYLQLGELKTALRFGRGFNYRIPHGVLTKEEKGNNIFYWRVAEMGMEWLKFEPVFFMPAVEIGEDVGLASMPTLGWKAQAAAGKEGVGFVQRGYGRMMGMGQTAMQAAVKQLYMK
jgi:hypothetical protein